MNRVKTFDSTGIAPNGRLYAGDLNLIQDMAAALADFSQNIQALSVAIGDSSLGITKSGTGQLAVSALLSVLSGLQPGSFTTTARDAIAAGRRPKGLVIFNTTTNQAEINFGTDAAPVWVPLGGAPAGSIQMFGGAAAPSGYLLCDGSAISRSTYAGLFTAIGTAYGVGDGSTTFNVPDLRGRVPVGLGSHGDVNALGASEGLNIAGRRPKHKHTVGNPAIAITDPGHNHTQNAHSHGITDPGHTHPEVTRASGGGSSWASAWTFADRAASADPNTEILPSATGVTVNNATPTNNPASTGITGSSSGGTVGPQSGNEPLDSAAYQVVNFIIKT